MRQTMIAYLRDEIARRDAALGALRAALDAELRAAARCSVTNDRSLGVVMRWSGLFGGDAFRIHANRALDMIRRARPRAVMADAADLAGIAPDDQQWLCDVWLPAAAALGVTAAAVVLPRHEPGRAAVEQVNDGARGLRLAVAGFEARPSAAAWLRAAT